MATANRTKQARTAAPKSTTKHSKSQSEVVVETPETIDATLEATVESEKVTAKDSQAMAKKSKAAPGVEEIKVRAYLLWLERGATHGEDVQDWLKAERELTGAIA